MKRIFGLLLSMAIIGFIALPSNVIAGACNSSQPGCINTIDIADGAVTDVKLSSNSVTTDKIVNNSVTAAKIDDGAGSGLNADLIDGHDSSEFSQKYANVLIVAQSGGDFTSIQTAIDSITPVGTPTLINVMPGTYTEDIIITVSNIHLQGAGAGLTTLEPATRPALPAIRINGGKKIIISDFYFKPANCGIWTDVNPSEVIVRDNTFDIAGGPDWGVCVEDSSTAIITNNIFQGSKEDCPTEPCGYGVDVIDSKVIVSNNKMDWLFIGVHADADGSDIVVSENTITNTSGMGILINRQSSAQITNNRIIQKAGSFGAYAGINAINSLSTEITGNIIRGAFSYGLAGIRSYHKTVNNVVNGSSLYDVQCGDGGHISFSMYSTISSACGGSFNVKPNGMPW